jgi:SAM-dependent methyltransferase
MGLRTLRQRATRAGKGAVKTALRWEYRRRYDADVEGFIYLDEFGLDADGRVWHSPSAWLPTLLAFKRLRLRPDDVIADLGAGKGTAVLLAAEQPVRRVVGVELANELAASARQNLQRNASRIRARDVEVVTADVLDWPIPDDLTVVYIYSAFVGDLFMQVIGRLLESYERAPRPLRLVYNFPFEHNRLLGTGRVRVLDVAAGKWPRVPGWWRYEEVIVTYGIGEGPFPPARGLRPPRAALERWSVPNDTDMRLVRPGRPVLSSEHGTP